MLDLDEPKCFTRRCKYFQGVAQPGGTEMSERVICFAFPDGIPGNIAYGDNLHLEPVEGQGNDIVYEQEED